MRFLVLLLNCVLLFLVVVLTAYEGIHVRDMVDLIMYVTLFLTPIATLTYLFMSTVREHPLSGALAHEPPASEGR